MRRNWHADRSPVDVLFCGQLISVLHKSFKLKSVFTPLFCGFRLKYINYGDYTGSKIGDRIAHEQLKQVIQ